MLKTAEVQMLRGSLLIRDATAQDAEAITAIVRAEMAAHTRVPSGSRLVLDPPGGPAPDFSAVLASPEFRTLLAIETDSDQIVGFAVISENLFSSLVGRPAIDVHYLVVPDQRRHRGVGRELLAAVTRFAEELSAEHVIVGVANESRDVNRYFAKAGFMPLEHRRIATVGTLRRTLGLGQPVAARETARRRIRSRFSSLG